jgi:nucleoside-diphosphate-sugar epimerase
MSGHAVVTGAAGFIGTHLVQELAQDGVDVRAVDVQPDPGRFRLGTVNYVCLDIRDGDALSPLIEGADTVYHLASAHLEVTARDEHYREVNVDAAWGLAEACAAAGVRRLVHVSSVGVYGHVESPPAREDAPARPGNVYERTKLEGEMAVARSAAATGLDLIVLRPAWVYGHGCRRMAKLIRSVRAGRFVYIGEGRNLRHPIYVSDVVDAMRLAAAAPAKPSGRIYNIAGPRFMELRELVETCARVLEVPPPHRRLPRKLALAAGHAAEVAWGAARRDPPVSRRSLAFFENDNAFDITAARLDLGFEPRVDLKEGIRRTVEDQRAHLGATV